MQFKLNDSVQAAKGKTCETGWKNATPVPDQNSDTTDRNHDLPARQAVAIPSTF